MNDTPETDDLARGNHVVPTEWAEQLELQRDEAREKLEDWENSAKHVRSEWPDEQHCSCVPILRKLLKDAERERDKYKNAILECLEENCHLADGEDCTLIGLKKALR